MKKVKFLACFLILGTIANAQQAQLVCDPSTEVKDTLIATDMVYVDSATHTIKNTTGKAIRTSCRLMYQGINGGPNAPTQQVGVKEVLYYDAKGNRVPERYVIRFITK